jgi:hypothetical protein
VYRTKLARTLLVLGIAACERADDPLTRSPLVDDDDRPAVGNIGQTGRPEARAPLVDHEGSPAVGNIGQTGAVDRRPLADAHGSPAVGNIGQTGRPATTTRTQPPVRRRATVRRPLAVQVPSAATGELRPRVDREGTPAVGNVLDKRDSRIATERALEPTLNRELRPAVGNIPKKPGKMPEPVEKLTTGRESIQAIEPLQTRERRPAVGNTPKKGR